jgi:hypothetical protein
LACVGSGTVFRTTGPYEVRAMTSVPMLRSTCGRNCWEGRRRVLIEALPDQSGGSSRTSSRISPGSPHAVELMLCLFPTASRPAFRRAACRLRSGPDGRFIWPSAGRYHLAT